MAKGKTGVQNRPMYSRISFLYQAATYLAEAARAGPGSTTADPDVDMERDGHNDNNATPDGHSAATTQALARTLLTDLRAVTLKTQIRITPDIKRTICRHCDTLLVEGQTCTSTVENASRGGRKPWADVLTIRCHTCGRQKRFPVNAPRQKRRPHRATMPQKQVAAVGATTIDAQPQTQTPP